MTCETCQLIGQTIQSNATFDEIYLGTYGEMQRRESCATCQQIVAFQNMPTSTKMVLMRFRQPASEYQITEEDQTDFMMDIIPLRPNAAQASHGVIFDEWIDIARIKSWLRFCDTMHQGSCRQKSDIPPVETLLLVDVEKGCLVEKPGNLRYFALSYVWGQLVDTAETRVCNLERFTKPGAINADTESLNLPKTIRDAIRLVQVVGERFLWVDRLCIVQDDYTKKAKSLQEMGSIYANAYCTIVAADGQDADYGLRGVGNGSQPRRCTQQILEFPHCGPVLQQQDPNTEKRSRWSTRGWTFQEQLCSKRLLIFSGNTVAWRCQRAEWREDITAEPEGATPRPTLLFSGQHTMLQSYAWPNLHQCELASIYNRRQLSFQSDARAAFAGVESIISPSFPGGFCYGLPELFFDAALLWQPARPMERRLMIGAADDAMGDDRYLPSWSWLGWHGSLDVLSYVAGTDYIRSTESKAWAKKSTLQLTPLVDWAQLGPTKGDATPPRKQRRIANQYHIWRHAAAAAAPLAPIPPTAASQGWRRHHDHNHGGNATVWFSHPAAPATQFGYPVPMPSREAAAAAVAAPHAAWPPLLRLRSSRAFFVIAEPVPGLDLREVRCVALRDAVAGCWAGVLRLNGWGAAGERCELVALSRGCARNDADESAYLEEWGVAERPADGEWYRFYNVLWVRRERDGCVTRRAVGRVEEGVWDGQGLEDVDLVLR